METDVRKIVRMLPAVFIAGLIAGSSCQPGSGPGIGTKTYEILKDSLYLKTSALFGRYRVSLSNDGKHWDDYVDFNREWIWNHISNMYFMPPDTLFFLNIEGETVSGIRSSRMKIIDVMSELMIVNIDGEWTVTERLRYEIGGKQYERYVPGSPRIAYRLTYDSILSSSPVWISLEPYLDGFTVCDSTGHASAYSYELTKR